MNPPLRGVTSVVAATSRTPPLPARPATPPLPSSFPPLRGSARPAGSAYQSSVVPVLSRNHVAYTPLADEDTPEPADCEILDPDELGFEDWELDSSYRPQLKVPARSANSTAPSSAAQRYTPATAKETSPSTSTQEATPITRATLAGVLVRAPILAHGMLLGADTSLQSDTSSVYEWPIRSLRTQGWRSPSPSSSIVSFGTSHASESERSVVSDYYQNDITPRKSRTASRSYTPEDGEVIENTEPGTPTRASVQRANVRSPVTTSVPSLLSRMSGRAGPKSDTHWPIRAAYRHSSQSSSVVTPHDSLLSTSPAPSSSTSLAPSASASRCNSPAPSVNGRALAARLNGSLNITARSPVRSPKRGHRSGRRDSRTRIAYDDDAMSVDVTPKRNQSFRPIPGHGDRPPKRVIDRFGTSNVNAHAWNTFSSANTYKAYIARGLNERSHDSRAYYSSIPLETRLSDRHWPEPGVPVRDRTVLIGPIPDDVAATALFNVLVRKVGPVDTLKVTDSVCRVVFEYCHAERARRALHNMVIDGRHRLSVVLPALVGREARADPQRRKMARFRASRKVSKA